MGLGAMLMALLITFTWAYRHLGEKPGATVDRRRLIRSTLAGAGTCLAAFTTLSVALGIMHIGHSATYRLPQDYLAAGLAGWLALLAGLAGILVPILVAHFIRQTSHH